MVAKVNLFELCVQVTRHACKRRKEEKKKMDEKAKKRKKGRSTKFGSTVFISLLLRIL